MKRPTAHWVCFCISQSNVSNQIRIKSQSLKTWKTQHYNHLVEEKVIFSSSLYVKTVSRSRSKITIAFFQFLTMRWWQLLRHHSGKKLWKFCWHNLFPIMQHRQQRNIIWKRMIFVFISGQTSDPVWSPHIFSRPGDDIVGSRNQNEPREEKSWRKLL